MIEHILMFVDSTASAGSVTEFVARLAITYQSKVTVLHAYKPAPSSAFGTYFLGFSTNNGSIQAKGVVNGSVKRLRQMGVEDVKGEVMVGSPLKMLNQASKSLEPDLIVIGSTGNNFPSDYDRIPTEAAGSRPKPVPVLIV